jgi:copper homeostasis protein
MEVGFERILTAGQRPKAAEGIDLIRQLVESAGDRIKIMPGSGVNERTVQEIVSKTKAIEIHFSATSERQSPMTFRNEAIAAMGEQGSSEFLLRTVDPAMVKRMRELAEGVSGNR